MQTSYFGNAANVSCPVSISRFPPRWWTGHCYPKLAPTAAILRAYKYDGMTKPEYELAFLQEVLFKLNPKKTYEELLAFGESPTLLCFEKPGQFCHRRLVADWLRDELFVYVPEVKLDTTFQEGFGGLLF